MHKDSNLVLISILTISLYAFSCDSNASTKTQFNIMETTIAKVHNAFENSDLTARQLVKMYLARIEAYDQSTKLNGHLVLTKQKVQSQALRLSVAILMNQR